MKYRGFYLFPALSLIGLGIGIIIGYQISGLIIGFGIGFLLSIARNQRTSDFHDSSMKSPRINADQLLLIILAFYIIISGVAIIWVPRIQWPEISAGFLILAGIWIVVHAYYRS